MSDLIEFSDIYIFDMSEIIQMEKDTNFDLKKITLINKIGAGNFGEVYKAQNNETKEIYAVKVALTSFEEFDDPIEAIHNISREVNIISKLNHPSIIKFIGFSKKAFYDEDQPVIITEFISNGSLEKIISEERKGISNAKWDETQKLITIYGIASALAYLHLHNIIHRDLKPANILMDDNLYPKIADFGLSKIKHMNQDSMSFASTKGLKGTCLYMAPEILESYDYTKEGDVYAFSLIVYEIITNDEPFKNISFNKLVSSVMKGIRPKFNSLIADSYKNLIEKCWSQDPKDRPSFESICNELKNDEGFITETIDENIYLNYIDFIDDYKTTFDSHKKIVRTDDFIIKSKNDLDEIFENWKQEYFSKEEKTEKKKVELIQTLKQIADKGHLESIKLYANLLRNGNEKEKQEAIKYYQIAITLNDSESMLEFGKMNQNGEGIPINMNEAMKYYKMAADNGNVTAMYIYSINLINGFDDSPPNTTEGIKYLKIAADKGHIRSIHNYAYMNQYGIGVPVDKKESIKYYKIGIEKGCIESMYNYALLLENGDEIPNNKKEAFKYFKMAADGGNSEAMFAVALKLHIGKEVPKNVKEAIRYYKMAIDKGNINSMHNYALLLEKGDEEGVEKNCEEACKLFKKAADKGDASSMSHYGTMLLNGTGIEANREEARRYFKMASEKGDEYGKSKLLELEKNDNLLLKTEDPEQLFKYWWKLFSGEGVKMNKAESIIFLKKAADKNHVKSILNYAEIRRIGMGCNVNMNEAFKYYKIGADLGELECIYKYATFIEKGISVTPDKEESMKYFKLAAEKGHPAALFKIGLMYFYGDIKGKFEEGVRMIKLSAEKGYVDAMNNYGTMLEEGNGVKQDINEALKYYKKAADKGSVESMYNYAKLLKNSHQNPSEIYEVIKYSKMAADNGLDESMFLLALIYSNGKDIAPNYEEAIKYYKMAIEKGHIKSINNYAIMLSNGIGVKKDNKQACTLFKIAADNGFVDSMASYAYMLENGIGTQMNKVEAAKYYKLAADKGNINAMVNYGAMLVKGDGIKLNINEAMKYYKMAAEKGNLTAKKNYEKLKKLSKK